MNKILNRKPLIILITGKARHGKDTFGGYLKYATGSYSQRVAFADDVKKIAKEKYGWNGEKDKQGRNLLQLVGHSHRLIHGEDYWIRRAYDKIDYTKDYVIVTDTRYKNEANWFKNNGFRQVVCKVVRLNSDGTIYNNNLNNEQKNHPSESEVDKINADEEYYCMSKMELRKSVNDFIGKWNMYTMFQLEE